MPTATAQNLKSRAVVDDVHIRFNNILLATDFSAGSKEALKTAIAVGKRFNAELFIAHAAPPAFLPTPHPELDGVPLETLGTSAPKQMEEFASYHGLRCVKHQTVADAYAAVAKNAARQVTRI